MAIHTLKCEVAFFQDLIDNIKRFEIRRNDRDYRVGDTLVLNEYHGELAPGAYCYSGRWLRRVVIYMSDFKQADGYVVLGLS